MSASAVLKLQKAGFTTEQVEALADFMDTQAASKADLDNAVHKLELGNAALRKDMDLGNAALRKDMDSGLASLRKDLDLGLASLRKDLDLGLASLRKDLDLGLASLRSEIADVRGELRLLEQRITVKLGGMLVAAVGVLIAAMRYLPPAGH
ncbi:hypothetical protein VQ03_08110 [Methylobacterium tarhaniae]|uniref:DUF1640 domain-containing protein n=1 Tax=Methylobacterium tarhaniae TaxID=1187852 RepID=A0A0J6TD34_9HYPH|nr:hypothetical protein [Methylobacterium tarhaniae]KMO43508.1 hypothetical protein VQ03_08110 [Methylobacterium tarhaniae]